MSALAEQHQRWGEARERLLRTMPPAPRADRARPMSPFHPYRLLIVAEAAMRADVPTPRAILEQVAVAHNTRISLILSPSKKPFIVAARRECIYRLYRETELSMADIGDVLALDFSTISWHLKQFEKLHGVEGVSPANQH